MILAEHSDLPSTDCDGCRGQKQAPIACRVSVGEDLSMCLCEECGRDLANAVGFMCIRDGGWSKLEPRKKRSGR